MAKAHKIAIKDFLVAVDTRDRKFFDNLTKEQKSAFGPWLMMRYLSTVKNPDSTDSLMHIFLTNELVNKDFSAISQHKELQYLLMTATGSGRKVNHSYIKPPNAGKKKNKVTDFLFEIYPHMKQDEVELLVTLNTKDELKELAELHGYDKKQIKTIFGK